MAEEEVPIEQASEDWLQEITGSSGSATSGLVIEGENIKEVEPPSPYCVKLDQWGKRRGAELNKAKEFAPLGLKDEDVADLHGMSFEMEPELLENCSDPHKKEFINALNENPDYQALHNNTCFDTLASELASLHFGGQYSTFVKKREEQQKKRDQQEKKTGKPCPEPSGKEKLQQEMEAMGAANKAVQQAAEEIQDLRDMQEAMGIGKEDGGGGNINTAELKKQFLKLKNDTNLKAITDLAGKYRNMARAKQRNKVTHGYDDMIGVELGGDLHRMLASELAMFCDEDMELDALRRFMERGMMCREYRAIEKVAKGPIMVGIDESGSMSGDRIQNAKAMALAMAFIAKQQGRWCGLFGWSSRNQIRMLALPPKNWPTGTILDWLSKMLNGGTHLPIEKMPEIYSQLGAQKGKTDIIIITDGEAEQHNPQELERFKNWKQEVSAKTIGISIAANSNALKAISDEYYQITSMSVDNEAVGKALSI
jgi:uncharacterized protein with von Willebrand factor type A (vWA) domain